MKEKILIIEDDTAIREGVGLLLAAQEYDVVQAKDGLEGLSYLDAETDLVILDIMMPGISGIKICEKIREMSNVPVLFLTAKDQESDKVIGFAAGGDDYLIKPFSYAELTARVKALLRRYRTYGEKPERPQTEPAWVCAGRIRINACINEVFVDEKEVDLTELEYKILLTLVQNPKKIFTIQNLYESVWGEPYMYSSGNTVMVHIRRLRMKIEDNPQKPEIIRTVWGKGYRLEEQTLE